MYVLRSALGADLPAIYNLQNVPFRKTAYPTPLLPYADFTAQTTERMSRQEKYFYLLEEDGGPQGFIEYSRVQEGWDLVIWGKWLYTLAYLAGKVAFEHLGFPNLVGIVRQDNIRMVRVYQKLQIRLVRSDFTLYYRPGLFSIASTYINYYEITPEEFREKSELMRSRSLPVLIR